MNEGDLKTRLKKALLEAMPGAVVIAHIDSYPAGTPDRSITWRGMTSWVEVKYSRGGRRSVPTALQSKALADLAAAGAPTFLLEYRESRNGTRTTELNWIRPEGYRAEILEGFDHQGAAELIRNEHRREVR